jgi:hypothetical protein
MSSHNEYRQFFTKAMEKFNINSPSDLHSDDQKKKFFNYIDKNWKSTSEEAELYVNEIAEANAFLKARSVAIWEGNEEFEFNGKIYPVIKVQEETE